MMNSKNSFNLNQLKVFGVALDASDDFRMIRLKQAAARAQEMDVVIPCLDPYDALTPELIKISNNMKLIGKVNIPSKLRPIPHPSAIDQITVEDMEAFVSKGGMADMAQQVNDFVKKHVLPGFPIMLGVDHSSTGGVVTALSETLGARNLSVLVLDQHFDGLPLSWRLNPQLAESLGFINNDKSVLTDVLEENSYCCGNFIKYLIDTGTVLPENLLFVGVADYPAQKVPREWEKFRDNYLRFEELGCKFFPLERFNGEYQKSLRQFIDEKIQTDHLYVSLDVDVGAQNCVHAARYMDRCGISRQALMDIAQMIRHNHRSGQYQLVGVDVMEFNTHFLGLQVNADKNDETISVALDFLNILLNLSNTELTE